MLFAAAVTRRVLHPPANGEPPWTIPLRAGTTRKEGETVKRALPVWSIVVATFHPRLLARFTICLLLVLTSPALLAADTPQDDARKASLTPDQIDSIRDWADKTDKLKSFQETLLKALDENTFNDRFKKHFDRLGEWTERVKLITALLNVKEGEYLKSKIKSEAQKAIWKQVANRLPVHLVKGLDAFSWAKTGMELFKDFVVDPALLDYGLDFYSHNRKENGLDPEDAIINTPALGTAGIELRKSFMKQLGPDAFVKGKEGKQLLPRWEKYFNANFNRFLAAWYETEYQKRLLAEAKESLAKEKKKLLEQEDELIEQVIEYLKALPKEELDQPEDGFGKPDGATSDADEHSRPPAQDHSITFGRPFLAPSQSAYDVGDEIHIGLPYELTGLLEDGSLELVRKFRITGKFAGFPGEGEWVTGQTTAAAGAEIYSQSFQVLPEFPSGEYRIEIVFEAAGIAIEPPPALSFRVSGLYAGAVYMLQEGENLIEQCQPFDAEALLQQVPAAVRSKTSPLYVALGDRAAYAIERVQAAVGQMAANLENLRLAEDLLNHCQIENSIKALDALRLAGLPEGCAEPVRSEAGALKARADERVAARAKMRELLAAGERDLAACRFSDAAAAGRDPVFGSGPECEEEASLAAEATALALKAEKREKARHAIEEQLGKGESALAEGRPDEATALAKQVIAAIERDPAEVCYPDQRARAVAFLAPPARQGVVAVAITGARQALQGQQLQMGSAITVDGVPVQDDDSYAYRWEGADGKSVTGKKSVTFTPRSPGDKVLRLTVTDPQGGSATSAATIFVPKLLQVSIGADKAEAVSGEKVSVTASIAGEEELCPCTFAWRAAGIGQTFTAKSVWFGYRQPGQYAVTLEVKDRFGQAASASHVLAVKEGAAGNTPGPAVSLKDPKEEERESLRRERERYQDQERERLEREQQRLERERQEQARRVEQERARREEERRRQAAEAERLRREQQERARRADDDEFFGDLRNRQEGSGGKSGSSLGDALFNAIDQIGRANQEQRRESERIEREWQKGRRELEERSRQEQEQRERQERQERARQEAARAKCEKEKQALRERLAGWQKGLDCLEEGKRKHPGNWLDCNGHWTMRDREVEIRDHRQWISNGRSRLDSLYCE
jgi:hypothetical protein